MSLFVLLLVFVGMAVGLAWFLVAHDRGEREPVAALWLAASFGLAGGVLAAFLESRLIASNNLSPGTPYGTLLLTSLAVGFIEEACKFVPLALVLYKRPYFNEHTDGVIYFALAGLGFGLPENILYTLQFGTKAGLARVLMTPFFHAATTGLVGYFLIKRKLSGLSPFGVWLPLGVIMVLHGLYDFGLSSGSTAYAIGSLLITLGLSIGLFMAFLRAGKLDRDRGLSIAGHNAFPLSYATERPGQHSNNKALLALLLGIAGTIGSLFMALIGLTLGILGLVMGTISRSGAKKSLSTAGLIVSSLAILASLAAWAYAAKQDPVLQLASRSMAHDITALAVAASSLSTPCYSVGFVDKLNISNDTGSCDMDAFNGSAIGSSTNAYKIYANQSTANSHDFVSIVKPAIEEDIRDNLPGFTINARRMSRFAGSPAYMVNAFDKASGVAVVEAAVLHRVGNGDNVFILVHAANSPTADLGTLEAQWQWK